MAEIVREPRAPFQYFGGKRNAAQIVWNALGDAGHYVEPFCGSCAILLARPKSHTGDVETVNDADGMLVNVWRAIRNAPETVAHECAIPVMEAELHARLAKTKEHCMTPEWKAWIEADENHFDAYWAANWLYCTCASIGGCWNDDGPWRRVKEADGEIRLRNVRELPHLGAGQGINRELPHLGNAGQGINRKLPHLGNAGRGINRKLPHLGNAGRGNDSDDILPHEANVRQYLRALARRLDRVRITCGDWRRVVSTPATILAGQSNAGIFLDPPYTVGTDVYAEANDVTEEVREWCVKRGGDSRVRIALCGFDVDGHNALLAHGWSVVQGKAGGSGYNKDKTDCRRERIWLSPGCRAAQMEFAF